MSDHRRQDPPAPPAIAAVGPSAISPLLSPARGPESAYLSKHKAPVFTEPAPVTLWSSVDVTDVPEMVRALRERSDFVGAQVSRLLLLARAAALASRDHQVVEAPDCYDLGVEALTGERRHAARVEQAYSLNARQLAAAMAAALADERATAHGLVTVADAEHLGDRGAEAMTLGVAGDSSMVLCWGAPVRRPHVVRAGGGEAVAIRDISTLSLSFDRNYVDVESAAALLDDVVARLSAPHRLFPPSPAIRA